MFSIVTWNVQWARPRVRSAIARTLVSGDPDIVVVTEGVESVLPSHGYRALAGRSWGYRAPADRRKVLLWSPHPLSSINVFDSVPLPPGRLVSAVCEIPVVGPVWVVGVCVPWRDAHVRTRRADAHPWHEHVTYLQHLSAVLDSAPQALLIVLAGDVNQRVPAAWLPRSVADALAPALGSLDIATSGVLPGLSRQGVDHICHSHELHPVRTWGVDRHLDGDRAVSDHDLVGVEFRC